jgi:oligopeptide/dipeptide ABC transporter ATP-binding protein
MSATLSLRGLRVSVPGARGPVHVVDGVDLDVEPGRTLGLVGESGAGKTLTALAILRLLPEAARIRGGRCLLGERDLLALPPAELRRVRGREIAMIFQEPGAALDPLVPVGAQIAEGLLAHERVGRRAARARAVELLARVGLSEPERRAHAFPHQLSGGMQQRVVIASAIACRPRFLIADEPTTALDVTLQREIVELVRALAAESGMGVLWITHDLALLASFADEVAVMYGGVIVERAAAPALFERPAHPYTRLLLRSLGRPGPDGRLVPVPGSVPAPEELPSGCRFRTRCPIAAAECAPAEPALQGLEPGHAARCVRIVEALEL